MYTWLDETRQLWFLDFVISPIDKNKILFSAGWFNGLVELNIETSEEKILSKFPKERSLVGGLHKDVICIKNKLYFCPRNTNYFCIYDLIEKKLQTYDLPENDMYWQECNMKFARLVSKDRYIYLIPCNYNQILCFDIESNQFIVYGSWFKEFQQMFGYKKRNLKYSEIFSHYIICNDCFLMKVNNTKKFMRFDILKKEVSFIDGPDDKIISIEKSERYQSVICKNGTCWYHNEKTGEFEHTHTLQIGGNSILDEFVKKGNNFYIPSQIKNEILIYDTKANYKKNIKFKTDEKVFANAFGTTWNLAFVWIKQIENHLWMLNQYNEIIIYNIETENYVVKRFWLSSQEIKSDLFLNKDLFLNQNYLDDRYLYYPYNSDSLEMFISVIKIIHDEKEETKNKSCGERIFKQIFS